MMNINLFILNNGQALLNIPVNNIKHNINLNILHLTIASQYRYYFNSNANYIKMNKYGQRTQSGIALERHVLFLLSLTLNKHQFLGNTAVE